MKLLYIIILIVFHCLSVKADSVSVMGSTNLNLWGQTVYQEAAFWYEYLGGDAQLDHGFIGVFSEGPYTNLNASIQLGSTFSPGTYSILLKNQQYPNGGLYPTFRLQAGDANISWDYLASTALGGQWTLPAVFTSSTSFSNIILTVVRTFPTNQLQQMVLMGVHINSNTNILIDKFDRIIDLTVSGNITSNTVSGNILENSSFELDMTKGWWNSSGDGRTNLVKMISTNSYSGTKSVIVLFNQDVNSRLYYLRPNATYIVSGYFKTSGGTRSIKLGLKHPFESSLPIGYTNLFPSQTTYTISNTWTRLSTTNIVRTQAGTKLYVTILCAGTGTNQVFADDIQLEEAPTVSAYAPKHPLEVSIITTNPLAVYVDGIHSNAILRSYNTGTSTPMTYGYETRDQRNVIVNSGTFSLTASNGISEMPINIHPNRRGAMSLSITNVGYEEEFSFSIVPPIRDQGTNAVVGGHATIKNGEYYVDGAYPLGSWFRGLSHAGAFRWDMVEPSNGTFNWDWSDASMSIITNRPNVQFLGVLYGRPNWASEPPITADWIEYVTNVVSRYPMVQYWEIDNEPSVPMTASQYLIMLTNTVTAIKAIQPSARILAGGGVTYTSWASDLMALLPTNYLTNVFAVSIHVYPNEPSSAGVATIQDFISIFSPYKVWNSESGEKSAGYRRGLDANYTRYAGNIYTYKDSLPWVQDMVWAADQVLQNHLDSIGLGCEVVFNYDSRLPANSVNDHQFSDIDNDDSIKTKGVQRAALAWMLDGTTNKFDASHSGMRLYAFMRNDGTILAGHYAESNVSLTITTTLTNKFRMVDSVGNIDGILGHQFLVGHQVGYLLGTNTTWSAWTNALALATQSSTTDTNAPTISFLQSDTYSSTNRVAMWMAIDDIAYPIENTPSAVLYSYRLNEGDWSSWSQASYLELLSTSARKIEIRAKDASGNISPTLTWNDDTWNITPTITTLHLIVNTLVISP